MKMDIHIKPYQYNHLVLGGQKNKGGIMEDRIIDLLEGYEPTIQEDFEPTDFSKPVDCGAKAEVKDAGRDTGITQSGENKNIFKISMQITKVVSVKEEKMRSAAKNRFVDVTYFVAPNKFQEPKEVIETLLNDLNTAGYPLKLPKEKMEDEDLYEYIAVHLKGLEGKILDVRCFPGKKNKEGERKQKTRIVNRDVTEKKKIRLTYRFKIFQFGITRLTGVQLVP